MGIRWDHSVEAIIKSLTISREAAGSVNGEAGHFRAMGAKPPIAGVCLRCDMAKSVTTPS
jgi:hypothetical protein